MRKGRRKEKRYVCIEVWVRDWDNTYWISEQAIIYGTSKSYKDKLATQYAKELMGIIECGWRYKK